MKIDLHAHSVYSRHPLWRNEAFGTPKQMIDFAIKMGLGGLAITDHDSIKGALEGLKYAKKLNDFLFVPGVEVTTKEGHVLALGVRENIPKKLSIQETIDRIHDLGGMAIAPHPYAGFRASSIKDAVRRYKFDAVEVINGGTRIRAIRKAYRVAKELKLPMVAGSDSHYWKDIGKIYNIIECDSIDSLFREIRKGRVVMKGRPFGFYSCARLATKKFLRSIVSRL